MKKISINKSDEVAVIVEKIIEAPDDEVVLSVPKFSHIGESLSNFHLLKREADALEKKVIVESVDDKVVELAEMSGLKAVNPFFAKNKRQFSDIVAPRAAGAKKRKLKVAMEQEPEAESEPGPDRVYSPEIIFGESAEPKKSRFQISALRIPRISLPSLSLNRTHGWIVATLLFLGVCGWAGATILPRATVMITPQMREWTYYDAVETDKAAVVDVGAMRMPNQVFSQRKNLNQKFPATGRRHVERSATGIMTIFNSYSSDPQPLVKTTRFMAPDGKIYRLTNDITVPGAKIVEGRIVPSSIDAEVVADEPGPAYNSGPVKLFTIPGFRGSPKYQSFYGESKGDMAGGFIGEVAYPTDDDIRSAKAQAAEFVEEELRASLLSQIPSEFKVLDGASAIRVVSQDVDEVTDENEQFSIFTEAQMSLIVFREEDVRNLLRLRALRDNGEDFDVRSFSLEYGIVRADFENGVMTFPVEYDAVLARKIDTEMLKENILGKSEDELRVAVYSLPGLDRATISLWPFWVKKVPTSPEKVKITIE